MKLQDVILFNRSTLAGVDKFVDDPDYNESPDNYGLPEHVKHLIDLPVGPQPTYVDLLMFLQTHFAKDNIKYVEIGVSVLKTFYQVSNFLKNSHLYAFDINRINPTMEKRLTRTRPAVNNLNQYKLDSNNISYFQGDVYSQSDFSNFKEHVGAPVNIVFSDAHHTSLGLASEFNQYIKDSLDEDFILFYDDLERPSMQGVFVDIAENISEKRAGIEAMFLQVNGWLGEHEHVHTTGIVSSLDLANIFLENNIQIPRAQLPLYAKTHEQRNTVT